ncbi:MAG: hypothetical protein P4L87_14940 [Formivibrio sp.]|nr:hypothetical protein [Formivibrio sp.]
MAKPDEPYRTVIVESFKPSTSSGLHGEIHIRPVAGQDIPTTLHVECSKKLSRNYPVGTKFRIKAKLTDREDSGEYLYSCFRWKFDVLK